MPASVIFVHRASERVSIRESASPIASSDESSTRVEWPPQPPRSSALSPAQPSASQPSPVLPIRLRCILSVSNKREPVEPAKPIIAICVTLAHAEMSRETRLREREMSAMTPRSAMFAHSERSRCSSAAQCGGRFGLIIACSAMSVRRGHPLSVNERRFFHPLGLEQMCATPASVISVWKERSTVSTFSSVRFISCSPSSVMPAQPARLMEIKFVHASARCPSPRSLIEEQ